MHRHAGTLGRADCFYDLIVDSRPEPSGPMREPMLTIRRTLWPKSTGQWRECSENVYGLVDESLYSSGAMLTRKQRVLGAIKVDRDLPLETETSLIECTSC